MTHRGPSDRRERAEHAAIRQVSERLARQFPELPPEEVDKAVHGMYDSFDDSAVRDFVPVLVERATRQRLVGERHGSGRA